MRLPAGRPADPRDVAVGVVRAHQALHPLDSLEGKSNGMRVATGPDLDKRAEERPRPANAA
jgi:hypothetical protein